jgi:hypothetical protein
MHRTQFEIERPSALGGREAVIPMMPPPPTIAHNRIAGSLKLVF